MSTQIAFFVQNNHVERLTAPPSLYAHSKGYDVIDRSSTQDFDVMNCGVDWSQFDEIALFGSVQFLRQVRNTPLACHVHYDEVNFDTSLWISIFGDHALNHDGKVMKACDVAHHLEVNSSAHVRPNSEDKAFIAAAFTPETWVTHSQERNVRADLNVYVSSIKQIDAEYRCWVIGGQIVEISQYRRDGSYEISRILDAEIHDAAKAMSNIYLPADAVVMDIAKTPTGFKLIEFNPIHGAGWYAADVTKILDAYVKWRLCENA